MAADPRRPGGVGPARPDDPTWPVGERRDGWLKVSDSGFTRSGAWGWRATQVWLRALRFAHLGRRPVLGPPLPLHPPAAPYGVRPAPTPPATEMRHALLWEPADGVRARLLRSVPPACLGLAVLGAYAGVRVVARPRMAADRSGRLTA